MAVSRMHLNGGVESEYSFVFTGDPTWKERANCRGKSDLTNVLFFPPARRNPERLKKALEEICGKCVVKDDCYKYGVESKAKEGVWGGVLFKRSRKTSNSGLEVV
jgi:hypothetical protein